MASILRAFRAAGLTPLGGSTTVESDFDRFDSAAMLSLPRDAPIFVTGHRGMVGSALVRRLASAGFSRILTATRGRARPPRSGRRRRVVCRTTTRATSIHAAGTVGGIQANIARPAEFLYDNLLIHATVLHAAWQSGVEKLLYLGSSCIYPRDCPQPIREEYLLTGPLEPTNEAYAIAKIAGLKSCKAYRRQYGCNFISAMPTNLYGPNDNFDLANSHVLAALIRKFHDARIDGRPDVTIWGTGAPAAGVFARRRPGRRLPVSAGALR